MLNSENNTTSLEELAIKAALKAGHKSPRLCERHNACLFASGADRKILEYKVLDIADIEEANIRIEDVDTSYCRDEIAPLIRKKAIEVPETLGLNYPILVSRRGKKYELINGHNRKWCMINLLNSNKIPAFIIDNGGTPAQKIKGKIKANSRLEDASRSYTIKDVILQLQQFERAGGFTDIGDIEKTKEEINHFLNDVHPYQFTSNIARGRIIKNFLNKKVEASSVHETWDTRFEDTILSRNVYPTRYYLDDRGKKTRYDWMSHVCENRKCFIGFANTNGDLTRGMVFRSIEKFLNPNFRTMRDDYDIHMIVKLHKIPSNIVDLEATQEQYLNELVICNKIISNQKIKTPLITEVIYPARLKSQEGKDIRYVYDKTKEEFVKSK